MVAAPRATAVEALAMVAVLATAVAVALAMVTVAVPATAVALATAVAAAPATLPPWRPITRSRDGPGLVEQRPESYFSRGLEKRRFSDFFSFFQVKRER